VCSRDLLGIDRVARFTPLTLCGRLFFGPPPAPRPPRPGGSGCREDCAARSRCAFPDPRSAVSSQIRTVLRV
jgi:hypothetical protein